MKPTVTTMTKEDLVAALTYKAQNNPAKKLASSAACSLCHNTFRPSRTYQLYCSARCRRLAFAQSEIERLACVEARHNFYEAEYERLSALVESLQEELRTLKG